MVYGWTTSWFLWRYPTWVNFLSAGEILGVLAYALVTNLLESLTMILAPILASLVLPRKWFHESFVARGTALVISGLGYMIYVAYQFKTKDDYPSLSLKPWSLALALVAILVLVAAAGRAPFVRKVLEGLANRATVFLYLTVPLSVAALLVILVRWLQ
jgi:hypothetical protein